MGNLAFDISKIVNLDKTVNLNIDKNVDVNVNIDDILATAEADAEAFGKFALAEVDAYTFANEGTVITTFIPHPGFVNSLGSSTQIIQSLEDENNNGVPDTITIDFTSNGNIVPGLPNLANQTGTGNLEDLSIPPPNLGSQIPNSAFSANDKVLTDLNNVTGSPGDPIITAQYALAQNWVVNFGERELDLDSDGVLGSGPLTLTIPQGTIYLVEFLDPDQDGIIDTKEYEYLSGAVGVNEGDPFGFFSYNENNSGIQQYPLTAYAQDGLEIVGEGISDWALQASSDFGRFVTTSTGGEAFAYSESTAALDLQVKDQIFDDPLGDTFGFGFPQIDIENVSGAVIEEELKLTMNFFTPIAAPSTGSPESVVGFWDLDLDQDPLTGAPSNQSFFAPPEQQGGPLGVEVVIDLFSEEFQEGLVNLFDTDDGFIGTAPITYGTNSLEISIPLSQLNDDGNLNYGTVIGTFSEPTDAAPNEVFGTVGELPSLQNIDGPISDDIFVWGPIPTE